MRSCFAYQGWRIYRKSRRLSGLGRFRTCRKIYKLCLRGLSFLLSWRKCRKISLGHLSLRWSSGLCCCKGRIGYSWRVWRGRCLRLLCLCIECFLELIRPGRCSRRDRCLGRWCSLLMCCLVANLTGRDSRGSLSFYFDLV